jgi:ferredoxin
LSDYCITIKGRRFPTRIVEKKSTAMLLCFPILQLICNTCREHRMFDIIEKHWPMSVGDGKATRKKKPRILAITTDCCTGCAGSPACIEYCPIEACMFWLPDEDHPPFGRIEVDSYLCIGCQKCTSKGPDGAFLDGCPWDAIEMVPTEDWEAMHGISLPDSPPAPPA